MHRRTPYGGDCIANITISEAVGLTGVSESTIRRDIKSGKVSSEKDEKGHRRIDTAELHRVYSITPPDGFHPPTADSQKVIVLLENQIDDLKAQLELCHARQGALLDERSQLIDLVYAEKAEKQALLPPVDEKPRRKSPNWLLRLVGVR